MLSGLTTSFVDTLDKGLDTPPPTPQSIHTTYFDQYIIFVHKYVCRYYCIFLVFFVLFNCAWGCDAPTLPTHALQRTQYGYAFKKRFTCKHKAVPTNIFNACKQMYTFIFSFQKIGYNIPLTAIQWVMHNQFWVHRTSRALYVVAFAFYAHLPPPHPKGMRGEETVKGGYPRTPPHPLCTARCICTHTQRSVHTSCTFCSVLT